MYAKESSLTKLYLVFVLVAGFALALFVLFWCTHPVSGAPEGAIVVTTQADELNFNGECSLREAILAANLDVASFGCPAGNGWDTIVIPAGVYSLTFTGAGEDGNFTGDLDIWDNVTLLGASAASTVIDANLVDRALHFIGGLNAKVINITIRNGLTPDNVLGGEGGGIYGGSSALTVDHCVVIGNFTGNNSGAINEGGDGGGIYSTGILHVRNSLISLNSTGEGYNGGLGGGIYGAGTMVITHTIISKNSAGDGMAGYGGHGGGIYNAGDLTLEYSTIVDNEAGDGTEDNSYGGWGGGLYNLGSFRMSYSTVNDNHAGDGESQTTVGCGGAGGGIYSTNYGLINNSTISRNSAGNAPDLSSSPCGGNGGGILNGEAITLTNSTVANNSVYSGDGGGMYISPGGGTYMHNTLLGDNIDIGGEAPDCSGIILSNGYNLVEDYLHGCQVYSESQPGTNVLGDDPLLLPLASNGGNTATHALRWSSPAIDQGQCVNTVDDQRNVTRPYDWSGVPNADDGCDIGAYERSANKVYLPIVLR